MASTNIITEMSKMQKLISSLSSQVTSNMVSFKAELTELSDELGEVKTQLSIARMGGTVIGEIKFFGYSKDRLPEGYYFAGGGRIM